MAGSVSGLIDMTMHRTEVMRRHLRFAQQCSRHNENGQRLGSSLAGFGRKKCIMKPSNLLSNSVLPINKHIPHFFLKGVCVFHGFWARGFAPRKKIALQRLVSCRFCMWREKWQAWQPPYFVRGAVNLREANESAESLRVNGGISSRL